MSRYRIHAGTPARQADAAPDVIALRIHQGWTLCGVRSTSRRPLVIVPVGLGGHHPAISCKRCRRLLRNGGTR